MNLRLNPSDRGQDQLFLGILMSSLDSCVAIADSEGVLVAVNHRWRTFNGRNPFVTGCGLGSSYKEACRRILDQGWSDLAIVALGVTSLLDGNIPRLNFDFPISDPEDTQFWGMVGCRGVGECSGHTVFFFRDITQRFAMERRLRKAEHLFKVTTDHALDFICLLNRDGGLVYHNPFLNRIVGHPGKRFEGKPLTDFIHEEDREEFVDALKSGSSTGLTRIFDYRLSDGKGKWVPMEGQASPVDDPGGQEGTILLISRDISLRKELEMERARVEVQLRHSQKMEAIGQLAAGIAHEINTPTQYIGDNASFLKESFGSTFALLDLLKAKLVGLQAGESGPQESAAQALEEMESADLDYLREEVPKAIQQTLEGVARISKIVNAMKDFSHPGNSTMRPVDLRRAIESTLAVSRNEWKYLAEIETEFDADLPLVQCYPDEFNQVILNLVVNAAHAIEQAKGGQATGSLGRIRIGTRKLESEVEVTVSDNGTGIPEEVQARVFEPFFTTKPVGKGTGQGLAIVHAVVVEKHRGRIHLESKPGQGTTFRIFLPLAAS